jgi:hypothetical protein
MGDSEDGVGVMSVAERWTRLNQPLNPSENGVLEGVDGLLGDGVIVGIDSVSDGIASAALGSDGSSSSKGTGAGASREGTFLGADSGCRKRLSQLPNPSGCAGNLIGVDGLIDGVTDGTGSGVACVDSGSVEGSAGAIASGTS